MKLCVELLSVAFETPKGRLPVLDRVSLEIGAGERVALVGESGSGKTVLALALLGLLPRNARVSGAARLGSFDLLDPQVAARVRGRDIAICWSDAERYFDPVRKVGRQIEEVCLLHGKCGAAEARRRALALLERMGIEDSERIYRSLPFQLSGGLNQRAMIAMSLAASPRVLIVDEPTRGLDGEARRRVIEALASAGDVSMLLITHDLELAEALARRVYFMRQGLIVDSGSVPEALTAPQHPYAQALVRAAR